MHWFCLSTIVSHCSSDLPGSEDACYSYRKNQYLVALNFDNLYFSALFLIVTTEIEKEEVLKIIILSLVSYVVLVAVSI
jgi:hypothetical protein